MRVYTCPSTKKLIDYPVYFEGVLQDRSALHNDNLNAIPPPQVDMKLMKKIWQFRLATALKILNDILRTFGKKIPGIRQDINLVQALKISYELMQTPIYRYIHRLQLKCVLKFQHMETSKRRSKHLKSKAQPKIKNTKKAFETWKTSNQGYEDDHTINFPKLIFYLRQLGYVCGDRKETESVALPEMRACFFLSNFVNGISSTIQEGKKAFEYESLSSIILDREIHIQGGSVRVIHQLRSKPNLIVTGSRSGTLALIDLNDMDNPAFFNMLKHQIRSIIDTPDGKILASSITGKVKEWNIDTHTSTTIIRSPTRPPGGLCALQDGKHFIYYTESYLSGNLSMFRYSDYQLVKALNLPGIVYSVIQLHDGLLAISLDHSIQIWNIYSEKCIQEFATLKICQILKQLRSGILVSASEFGDSIEFWDLHRKDGSICSHCPVMNYNLTSILELSDRTLAIGTWEKSLQFWNPYTGKTIRKVENHDDCPYNLLQVDDGRLVVGGYDRVLIYR